MEDVLWAGKCPYHYENILPSLRLASRIILNFPQIYLPFASRAKVGCIAELLYLDPERLREIYGPDECQKLIELIHEHLPAIGLKPVIGLQPGLFDNLWARTTFSEDQDGKRDTIWLPYELVNELGSMEYRRPPQYHKKAIITFFISTLILRELRHVLERRGDQERSVRDNIPPAANVERPLFGGPIEPILSDEDDITTIRGVGIRLVTLDCLTMEFAPSHIEFLLNSTNWRTRPELRPPLQTFFSFTALMDPDITVKDPESSKGTGASSKRKERII
ncbi:hypothetical protein TWF694_005022 [Orbilia ellipsospora]|uniref:Uncharacterized protein n=1 Tax=Orbilia ellipsospora TaxID=2528407 RepID=A0AAV9WWW5_9PEZI